MPNTLSFTAISSWPSCAFTPHHSNTPAVHGPALLGKIRQHQPIQKLSLDYPGLTQEQLALVQGIQVQEQTLAQLYQELQAVEVIKAELERELIDSLSPESLL
jgi:hypothetical protein